MSLPSRTLLRTAVTLAVGAALLAPSAGSARTREFCAVSGIYGGKSVDCGGHLEPFCTSGASCDAGHNAYSDDPFPITIDCPTIRECVPLPFGGEQCVTIKDIPDVTVSGGCYDRRPTCNDCGGEGQAPCPSEAEPVCAAGCDEGLASNPTTTLCEVPGSPGSPCGPGFPCSAGLTCDPFSGFVCVEKKGAGESCANPFEKCAEGLQCTLALQCSHEPARVGETCDVTAPCGDGLYCQAGVPQRCREYRKPGQGCSVVNPCIDGASCEPCLTDKCHSPLQCFWNANNGAITEQQCRTLFSPGDSQLAQDEGLTLTYAAGDGISAGIAEAQSFGFAYGADGRYGCFTTFCYGIDVDASVEAFIAVGFYDDYDDVGSPEGGLSYINVQEAQIPGSLLNFSAAQIYERFGAFPDFTTGDLVGGEDALSVGVGASPSPFAAGSFLCETVLDTVIDPFGVGPEPPPPPAKAPPLDRSGIQNPDFDSDLDGWDCTNGGVCAWVGDDPFASTISGAGEVASPPAGSLTRFGRLESGCVAVDEGATRFLSAWLKTSGSRDGQLRALWTSSESCVGGVVRNDLLAQIPPDGAWHRVERELEVPAGAVAVSIQAIASRGDAAGTQGVTRLDAVYVPEPGRGLAAAAAMLALGALWTLRRRVRRA